jgi:small subunit ribosomal protein S18e
VVKEREFLHILRVHNTNLNGNATVPFAFTAIKGVGRRYSILCVKKAGVDITRRAGELSREQVDKIVHVMSEPQKHGVPGWFLNRQKDRVDGTTSHLISNDIGARLRQDLERLKKIRHHRGLRHYWGLRVRGQHTCSTGRKKAKAPGGKKW